MMNSQKGFVQIPILIIAIIVIAASAVGAGVVLHKHGKSPSITADISGVLEQNKEIITVKDEEAKEELQNGQEPKSKDESMEEEVVQQAIDEDEIVQQDQELAEKTEPKSEIQQVQEETTAPEFIPEVEEEKAEEVSKTKYATIIKLTDTKDNVQLQSEYNGKNTTWLSPWPELKEGETITIRVEINNIIANPVLYQFVGTGFPNTWQTEDQVTVTIDNDIFNLETIHLRVFVKNSDNQYKAPYYDDMIQVFYKKEMIAGTEVGGIISENTIWTTKNSPYIITSTVQIPLGVTLTIKSGVIVTKPTSGDMFLINGAIYAHGIKGDSITFDGGNNSDFFHITGSNSAFLDLEYCIVKNGFMFWPGGNHNGHFHLQHSELINLAEQSTIAFPSGNININYNKFVNTYGFRIFTDNDVKVCIKNNFFYKGHSVNNTGYFNFYIIVMSQDSSEVIIKYNSFIDMSNIVLKLSDGSINTFSASENYWGTQDRNAIESMIYDRNDDIRCVGYVNYLPILEESHSNTPEL